MSIPGCAYPPPPPALVLTLSPTPNTPTVTTADPRLPAAPSGQSTKQALLVVHTPPHQTGTAMVHHEKLLGQVGGHAFSCSEKKEERAVCYAAGVFGDHSCYHVVYVFIYVCTY